MKMNSRTVWPALVLLNRESEDVIGAGQVDRRIRIGVRALDRTTFAAAVRVGAGLSHAVVEDAVVGRRALRVGPSANVSAYPVCSIAELLVAALDLERPGVLCARLRPLPQLEEERRGVRAHEFLVYR